MLGIGFTSSKGSEHHNCPAMSQASVCLSWTPEHNWQWIFPYILMGLHNTSFQNPNWDLTHLCRWWDSGLWLTMNKDPGLVSSGFRDGELKTSFSTLPSVLAPTW